MLNRGIIKGELKTFYIRGNCLLDNERRIIMNKNSRGLRNFQFFGTVIVISLAIVGMITDSKVIEDAMGILFLITTVGVLACLVILVVANFFCTQKIYKYVLYYYNDIHSHEQEKYKSYFAGYSADKMAEIEKKYNDRISDSENGLNECLKICLDNFSLLTRKQRRIVSNIIKSRESSRA